MKAYSIHYDGAYTLGTDDADTADRAVRNGIESGHYRTVSVTTTHGMTEYSVERRVSVRRTVPA